MFEDFTKSRLRLISVHNVLFILFILKFSLSFLVNNIQCEGHRFHYYPGRYLDIPNIYEMRFYEKADNAQGGNIFEKQNYLK